jgi:hypothetical protein
VYSERKKKIGIQHGEDESMSNEREGIVGVCMCAICERSKKKNDNSPQRESD